MLGVQAVRLFVVSQVSSQVSGTPSATRSTEEQDFPFISILIPAKNEASVIGKLLESLCHLDYPEDQYEIWAIDDSSTDGTAAAIEQLAQRYKQVRLFRRSPGAGGGKSGALNQVLPLTKGEIIAVFDADARVTPEVMRRVMPTFDRPEVGAIQLRKVIANANVNFWTRGQATEMIFDAYFQQLRAATGGIGELRGNGQLIRRRALERCGGFNEATITDDLDLTFRLHLDGWEIECLMYTTVAEEGVTNFPSLWHQRNRWAEGGYQRYLDYWRPLCSDRLPLKKRFDAFLFCLLQYLLPMASVPDLLMSLTLGRFPLYAPITGLTVSMTVLSMYMGLRKTQNCRHCLGKFPAESAFVSLGKALQGTLYMLHWFLVMAGTTARLAVRPKRLKWVKTEHLGTVEG
jgi:1,2-diacylglycerol 3-beta-glucosyltransferase